MFLSLNRLRIKNQHLIHTNIRSIFAMLFCTFVGLAFVCIVDGWRKYFAATHLIVFLSTIEPSAIQQKPNLIIDLFANSKRTRAVTYCFILLNSLLLLMHFLATFVWMPDIFPKKAEIDNFRLYVCLVEVLLMGCLLRVNRSESAMKFERLSKHKMLTFKAVKSLIFLGCLGLTFCKNNQTTNFDFVDMMLVFFANLFLFSNLLSRLFSVWLAKTELECMSLSASIIDGGLGLVLLLAIFQHTPAKHSTSRMIGLMAVFLLNRCYFIINSVVGFQETLKDNSRLENFNIEIQMYCIENDKIRTDKDSIDNSLEELEVVQLLRGFISEFDRNENEESLVVKVHNSIVTPAVQFLLSHSSTFVFVIEVVFSLFLWTVFDKINTLNFCYLLILLSVTSICTNKSSIGFPVLLLLIYTANLLLFISHSKGLQPFSMVTGPSPNPLPRTLPTASLDPGHLIFATYQLLLFLLLQLLFLRNKHSATIKKSSLIQKIDQLTFGFSWKVLFDNVVKVCFALANLGLMIVTLRELITELNLLNLVFLFLAIVSLFRNSQDFRGFFRLVIVYQTVRVLLV
jgi:hypothetical protein